MSSTFFPACPCTDATDAAEMLELDFGLRAGCVCAEYGCEGVGGLADPTLWVVRAAAWALVDALRSGVELVIPRGSAEREREDVELRCAALGLLVAAYREEGNASAASRAEADRAELMESLAMRPVVVSVAVEALLRQLGVGAAAAGCCRVEVEPASSFGPVRPSVSGGSGVGVVLGSAEGTVVVHVPAVA